MYAGLDFGTSNCLIGIWKDNGPTLLPLEGQSKRLPSALYTSRQSVNVGQINNAELQRRVSAAKRKQSAELTKAKKDS